MSFGRTPLPIPEGAHYETDQKVERLDFEDEGGGIFIVLHFEPRVVGRATSVRAPITQATYEAYVARNVPD